MVDRRFSVFFFTALLLVAALLALTNAPLVPRVAAANRSISLVGLVSAWNSSSVPPNPTIIVTRGDIVTITLSSGDTLHQFALDVDKDGAKFTGSCSTGDICSNQFTPSTPTSVIINTSNLSGNYTYFCTIHSGMVGSFVVAARSIALVGLVSAWNSSSVPPNPTITVTQGDIITITLSSGDTLHQFALDVDRDGAKFTGSCSTGDTCSSQFTPSTPVSVTINTGSLSGTYTYFCTIHSSMVGSFVVKSPGTVGGRVLQPDMLALVAPYIVLASALAVVVAGAVGAFFYSSRRKEGNRSGEQ